MPSIIRDAKQDAALSGIVCNLRQEHIEFCDFVREFPPSLRSEKGCAEPSHAQTHARMISRTHRRLAEVRGADLPRTLTLCQPRSGAAQVFIELTLHDFMRGINRAHGYHVALLSMQDPQRVVRCGAEPSGRVISKQRKKVLRRQCEKTVKRRCPLFSFLGVF